MALDVKRTTDNKNNAQTNTTVQNADRQLSFGGMLLIKFNPRAIVVFVRKEVIVCYDSFILLLICPTHQPEWRLEVFFAPDSTVED